MGSAVFVNALRRRSNYNIGRLQLKKQCQAVSFPGRCGSASMRESTGPVGGLLQVLSRKLASYGRSRIDYSSVRSDGEFCKRELRSLKSGWKYTTCEWRPRWKPDRAWKSWLGRYNLKGYYYHPLWRIIGAMSLAVVRSQFTPRLAAFLLGEATLLQRCIAQADSLPSIPFLYQGEMQPTYLLSVLFSLLEGIALFLRAIYLLVLFTPAVAMVPFADSMDERWRKIWLDIVHHSLEQAGAAFIKWGQWAATRPDLFPKDLCETLSKLHTKAPAHSFVQTRRIVEGAFGRKIEELFDDFEEEPVASGSIAQVHRAILKTGEKKPTMVAVKVRHPGVTEVIRRDFVLINGIARLSSLFSGLRYLRLEESVQQFAVFMLTQVDLAREAAHLSRFLYNFRTWKDVSFPKPLYPLVHPAVLVETYERGESVSRYVDSPGRGDINSALAHIGTHTLLKMLLVDNFIHADLHPGNILVRMERGNSRPGKGLFRSHPHIILLDVGMTAELSQKDRATLIDFFKAIALWDGRKTAECTLQFTKLQTCPDPEGFVREVEACFDFWRTEEAEMIHAGECIQELLERVRRHKVNIDGDVCTVMVTTLVLEGWQRKLDPEYNIMGTLQNLLLKADWATSFSHTMDSIMAP